MSVHDHSSPEYPLKPEAVGFQTVYLIGFMGAGKTTLGKQLAESLGWPFLDLDDYIERREGQSVRDIFAQRGEAAFRALERRSLLELTAQAQADRIIACGGGTPCFGDHMDLLNQTGTTIYLQVPVAELARRLEQERAQRPLLRQVPPEELEDFIEALLNQREVFYLRARHVIDLSQSDHSTLVSLIQST
ncbi:MAG: shikimate kinase [Bacteroidota bacterium]